MSSDTTISMDRSDLEKLCDALRQATTFLQRRDEMNASVHLATQVRYSPLTTVVEAALKRAMRLLEWDADARQITTPPRREGGPP